MQLDVRWHLQSG